jgi:hypothetical protein
MGEAQYNPHATVDAGRPRWTIVAIWDDLWSPTPHRGGRAAALRDEKRRVQSLYEGREFLEGVTRAYVK